MKKFPLRSLQVSSRITLLGVLITTSAVGHPVWARSRTWAQECARAMHSRALLARSGALLAFRDRTLEHPAEVMEVYRRESDEIMRRRMALVLGETSMRQYLLNRAVDVQPGLTSVIADFNSQLEVAHRANAQYRSGQYGTPLEGALNISESQMSVVEQSLARSTKALLARLLVTAANVEDERESQLLRWSIERAVLDVMALQTNPSLWSQLSHSDQIQVLQMFSAVDGRESVPVAYPASYKEDPNTPYVYALRLISS
ncbi:MAG: hypothetical protein EOO38_19110, partial [Cytophagaceae bacterium]